MHDMRAEVDLERDLTLHLVAAGVAASVLTAVLLLLWLPGRTDLGTNPSEQRLQLSVPYPILFLHGLGGKGKDRYDGGLTGFLQLKGLRYGGRVVWGEGQGVVIEDGNVSPERGDFFYVQMSDSFQRLDKSIRELRADIREVLARTGAPKVVLLGFSAGGMAARKYVVENPEDHKVARLVIFASPHLGSELALAVLIKDGLAAARAKGWQARLAVSGLEAVLEKLEDKVGVDLDKQLVRDLLPEPYNEPLEALNRKLHPANLEYACIRTVGASEFQGWKDIEAELVALRTGDLLNSRVIQRLTPFVMSAVSYLGDQPSWRGDGAVLLSSQDLREIDYFLWHPGKADALIAETATIDAGHIPATTFHRSLLEGIASKVRYLSAYEADGSTPGSTRIALHFLDYFAGALEVTAHNPSTQGQLPVARPAVFRQGLEGFARVVIGPFDRSDVPTLNVKIRSLGLDGEPSDSEDRPRNPILYGKQVIVGGESAAPLRRNTEYKPPSIKVRAIRNIPGFRSDGKLWDHFNGSAPDLRLVLLIGQEERDRTAPQGHDHEEHGQRAHPRSRDRGSGDGERGVGPRAVLCLLLRL